MAILIILPVFAIAQMDEIKEYTVTKGDTLWDISSQELNDFFLWPKVWKENPEIENPDLIFPGQKIRIPLYLLQEFATPTAPPLRAVAEPKPERAVQPVEPKPSYLVSKNLLIASGYISDSIPSHGTISGSPEGKTLLGNGDLVFVKTRNSVDIGDTFYILRGGQVATHPKTNRRLGYVIEILGVAKIKDFDLGETIAEITHSFNPITIGDHLDPYYEINPPLAIESPRKPDIKGYIVATTLLREFNSSLDVIYIDKGLNHGIQVGDMFRTINLGDIKTQNGFIQIINAQDATSTAVVRKSTLPISKGNLFSQAR
jgi:hypothetical protein